LQLHSIGMKNSLIVIIVLVALLTSIIYYFFLNKQTLPILSGTDVNPELVDPSVWKSGNHFIKDFTLTDQHGETTSQEFVEGKIYVTDFFFTTCQTICPIMTGQMHRVSDAFKEDNDIKFLSYTVLPDVDTPEVLREYANKNKVDYDQWRMLTGEKAVIYDMARKSYFTLKKSEVGEGDGGEGFIHTNNFVLVDKENRIRGYYDGTSLKEINKLIEDIKILRRN